MYTPRFPSLSLSKMPGITSGAAFRAVVGATVLLEVGGRDYG